MSSSNVMEVITKGRYMYDGPEGISEPSSCRSSTSHSVRTESQLSLEYLPPEAPYYGNISTSYQSINSDSPPNEMDPKYQSMKDDVNKPAKEQMASTNQLFERIQALSEQIHSELGTMHEVESLESYRPTPVGSRGEDFIATTLTSQMSGRASTSITNDDETANVSDLSMDSTVVTGIERLDFSSDFRADSPNECRELVCFLESQEERREVPSSPTNSTLATPRVCDSNIESKSGDPKGPSLYNGAHLDPKVRKALEKMKKLDEKLADLDKKEKEVKKQTKLLERQIESSIGGSTSATSALSPDREIYTPVFTTQLNDGSSTAGDGHAGVAMSNPEDAHTEEDEDDHKQKLRSQDNTSGTNFIKRNIELASDAGALVAMTEAEKNRLEQLLTESDEPDEDSGEGLLTICAADSDEGFIYQKEDFDRMKSIDSQLQAILPPKEWESISCSSRNGAQSSSTISYQHEVEDIESLTPTLEDETTEELVPETEEGGQLDLANHIGPGEEVLHQFQMSRSERERLKDIDERLRVIQEENERTMQALLPLPASDLRIQSLLDQYSQEKDSIVDTCTSTDHNDSWDIETDGNIA